MAEIRLLELRNTYKWGGGPDKTILLSAEKHTPELVSVVVVYIRDANDTEFQITQKAQAKGLTFYEIVERGKVDLRVLTSLQEIVLRHDINLIHSHDYKSDFFAYLLRWRMLRRPITLVSTAHAWVILGFRGTLYRRLDLWLMRRFDHLIAVSHATKEEMLQAGLPDTKITVIHNAIDAETWAAQNGIPNRRDDLRLDPACPLVGYVGRIMPEKDLDTWLRAAAIVAAKHPKAQFLLVGDGHDETTKGKLLQLAEALGIAERTIFLGYQADLLPIYAAMDVFMLSSRREGLPNSILEAMAMGLPVVTTDVAGASELVAHDHTGFVLPIGDVHGLAQALLDLLENTDLRRRMGQHGRQRIEQEFSFTRRLLRIESLYAQLLNLQHYCSQTV